MLLETEDERLAYRTLVRDVLVLLNADVRVAERDSLEILRFETELANVCFYYMKNHLILAFCFVYSTRCGLKFSFKSLKKLKCHIGVKRLTQNL